MATIYHNPRCSKSRQALGLLEAKGIKPNTILYLDTPPDEKSLRAILKKLGITARELLRKGEDEYKQLQLDNTALTENELITAMCTHPRLIERPIVINGNRAVIGRPPEKILEII
ncbi:MAG TPA: arsenate reductase (glutaredoxin) [Pseudomonadales bacterium]|nr:arsenate reductase (glutaredoxin) [Pseudomonadales bacterium]